MKLSAAIAALRDASDDVRNAAGRPWLWGALGRNDLRQRHAGSVLGRLWISANLALVVACLTFVFAGPLGGDARLYAPYVAIGLLLWQLIQASLTEAAQAFTVASESIRNVPMPLSTHLLRLVWRNLLAAGYGAVLVPVLLLALAIRPAAGVVTLVPALALLLVFLFTAGLLLAILGARFRDVGPIVGNVMQLLFFVTPVFWLPSAIGADRAWIAALNPLFAFIDIIRAPLLGGVPMPHSWAIAAATTAATTALGLLALAAGRRRVAFWV